MGLKGELRWEGAAGCLSRDPGAAAVTLDTVFDLASLTKPLATALALMVLADRGQLDLATPLGEVLPAAWLPPDKRPLTLGSLLTHRAGLPAWRPFYQEVLAAPASSPPCPAGTPGRGHAPGIPPGHRNPLQRPGLHAAQGGGGGPQRRDLDQFCREEIYRPLGLTTLGFNPLPKPAKLFRRPRTENRIYAATEPGLIPGRPSAGEVHDENAWAAGGVAGHAGLFGPGREVFHLVACLYRAYGGETIGPLTPAAVQLFLTVPPGADRACGFDTPGPDPAQRAAGRYFSPRSVGHLGFTGTSFWLDLDSGQMVVLLTNRVHLGRDDKTRIPAFRPRFHEAASRALGFTSLMTR